MSTVKDPESIQQLIADCSDIPNSLDAHEQLVLPRRAPHWEVDDACCAQVEDLDEYI